MVSQPEPYQSRPRRGPASAIVSRHAPSRSKRYNRSHAGGDSYIPQNEFPVFTHSGDVEIVIRAGPLQSRYLLHRHTLTRCSGFFEASTSEEWSRHASTPAPAIAAAAAANKPKRLVEGNEVARLGTEVSASGSVIDLPSQQQQQRKDTNLATTSTSTTAATPRKKWRYELDWGDDDNDIAMLVQKDSTSVSASEEAPASLSNSIFGGPNSNHNQSKSNHAPPPASYHNYHRSKRSHSHSSSLSSPREFARSVANLTLSSSNGPVAAVATPAEEDLLRDYDNLLRIFYNYPPLLDGVSVADAYVQCKRLLGLADQYDSLGVVGPRVDHHLLQFQARLWKQVAKYPVSYLRLGYLARSKVIFQEALVHVVGQWPTGERSLRASLPTSVLDLIEDKVDEMEETISRVEGRLFRIHLFTSRGDRVTPANNYLDWLAISLFRQWLADNTMPNSSTGRAYRTLAGRSNAFLPHAVCKEFLKLTPDMYSRDNLRRFEKRLDEIKAMAREVVLPVMGSSLELDLLSGSVGKGSEAVGYLTCTSLRERDLPWSLDG